MPAPDPASLPQAWLRKADEDILNMRNNLAAAQVPWSTICFHAQQAAEKSLKALLVHQGVPVSRELRTHDLEWLARCASRREPRAADLLAACSRLTAFAIDVRYPDVLEHDEERIAREAYADACRVREAIESWILGRA